MKIMVSGDKHLGLVSDGMERLEEQSRLIKRTIEILNDEDPDMYVDLGDLFHVSRPGPAPYNLALKYLTEIANWTASRARYAFLMVGNHDKQTRGHIHALTPFIPVIDYISKVDVNKVHGIKLMQKLKFIYHRGYYLVFLPHITDWEARTFGQDDAKTYLDKFSLRVLDQIRSKPFIVFSHLEVPGAKMSNNETVQRDTGLQIPSNLIDAENLVRVYAGHIHKYQEMKRVTVVGSALHVDFGEALDQKGIIISEVKS
jgi:DNA repair exonuclease SbcCD nuclease subunit